MIDLVDELLTGVERIGDAHVGDVGAVDARELTYYAPEGTTLWLVDAAYEVLAHTELSSATKRVEIAPTCDTFVST